jgi:YD repeat-containing protein
MPQRLLRRIVLPDTTFPRALPDGTTGLTALVHEYLTYDARGRLTRERLPGGSETTYEYVAPGPLSGPRAGQLFRMTRDANGLALSTTYALNDAGVITGVTNPRQMLTRHIVNELDQIEEVISAGPQYHTRMLYDPCGLVERRERDRLDSSGQPLDDGLTVETFQYDVENRVRVQTIGSGDLASHYVTTRCYNTAGELEQLTTPRATITRYVYDERFLPIRTVRAVRTPVESTRLVRYDEDGMVLARVDGEGAVSRLVRDALGRELRSIDPLGHVQQIEYDKRDALVVQRRFERLAAGGYALIERLEREYDEQGRSIRDIAFVFRDPIPTADPEGDPDAEFAAGPGGQPGGPCRDADVLRPRRPGVPDRGSARPRHDHRVRRGAADHRAARSGGALHQPDLRRKRQSQSRRSARTGPRSAHRRCRPGGCVQLASGVR